eukprot:832981-Prymnesium_polylepis.1
MKRATSVAHPDGNVTQGHGINRGVNREKRGGVRARRHVLTRKTCMPALNIDCPDATISARLRRWSSQRRGRDADNQVLSLQVHYHRGCPPGGEKRLRAPERHDERLA